MPDPIGRRARRGALSPLAVAFACAALLAAGCRAAPPEVAATAQTGAQAAGALRDYYKTLSDDVETILELESFLSTLRGVPFDDSDRQLLVQQIAALDSRARAADRLASAYSSLGTLAGTDAPAVATTAGQNLAQALGGITRMPQGVDPAPIVGSVTGEITRAIESRELAKANRAMISALGAAQTLFARERDLYQGIVEERANKIGVVEDTLLSQGVLDPSPLLQQLATLTGLPLRAGAQPSADVAQALSALAMARTERLGQLTAAAGESVEASLLAQIEAQTALAAKRRPSLGRVTAAIGTATTFLDQIATLKQQEDAARAAAAGGNP